METFSLERFLMLAAPIILLSGVGIAIILLKRDMTQQQKAQRLILFGVVEGVLLVGALFYVMFVPAPTP